MNFDVSYVSSSLITLGCSIFLRISISVSRYCMLRLLLYKAYLRSVLSANFFGLSDFRSHRFTFAKFPCPSTSPTISSSLRSKRITYFLSASIHCYCSSTVSMNSSMMLPLAIKLNPRMHSESLSLILYFLRRQFRTSSSNPSCLDK